MTNGQATIYSDTHTQAFDIAKKAVLTLKKVRGELTPPELETLEVLADPKSVEQLKKSYTDVKQGRIEPLKSILN